MCHEHFVADCEITTATIMASFAWGIAVVAFYYPIESGVKPV